MIKFRISSVHKVTTIANFKACDVMNPEKARLHVKPYLIARIPHKIGSLSTDLHKAILILISQVETEHIVRYFPLYYNNSKLTDIKRVSTSNGPELYELVAYLRDMPNIPSDSAPYMSCQNIIV